MRIAAVCVLAVTVVLPLSAGIVHFWRVSEIENAPLLAVATVQAVQVNGTSSVARLNVRRAFPTSAVSLGGSITLNYTTANRAGGGGGSNGGVYLEQGMTILIPLINREGDTWRPFAESGLNLFVPAIVSAPSAAPPVNGRAFILGELASALANGDPATQSAAAVYLRNGNEWPDGFREALEAAVGSDDDRWLAVAWAVVANMGIPHSSIDQLMANKGLSSVADKSAAWVLEKGAKREYPDRLLRYTVRNLSSNEWGATNILLDFKNSQVVIEGISSALRSDPGSALWSAWTLVRNGQTTFQAQALDAAAKLVSNPTVPVNRLQPAAWLLRDYGSDKQFEVVLTSLRQLKTTNTKAYGELFGAVDDRQNRRLLKVNAILIDDRRVWSGDLRYCDLAAASLETVSGQYFGMSYQATPAERDRAVASASAWLAKEEAGR